MCFSVVVRPDDSQTALSVTQLAVGAGRHVLENMAPRQKQSPVAAYESDALKHKKLHVEVEKWNYGTKK